VFNLLSVVILIIFAFIIGVSLTISFMSKNECNYPKLENKIMRIIMNTILSLEDKIKNSTPNTEERRKKNICRSTGYNIGFKKSTSCPIFKV